MFRDPTSTLRSALHGLLPLVALVLVSGAQAGMAPLDTSQQRCVNAVNKAFAKAVGKANRAGLRCLQQISKGAESASFAECSQQADLSSAAAKVARAVEKKCEAKGVDAAATFAYTGDASGVAAAALEGARASHADLLGDPASVADKADRGPAVCQKTALGALARYGNDLAKATNRLKKGALRGKDSAPVETAEALAAALLPAPDDARVLRSLDRATSRVASKCQGEDVAALFPGSCAGESPGTLSACAAGFARCRLCEALAAADGLPLDCEGFAGVASCTAAACGDGVLDAGEACDDGNLTPGDGCRSDCSLELCGDGVLDPSEGCDDGNTSAGDGCGGDCVSETCGDGVLDANEACDDGNTVSGDGCRENCTEELCGDGVLDAAEDCDDGNTTAGDGCRGDCTPELCGDGVLDAGEDCDDGDNSGGDGCRGDCTLELCGDGVLDAGEDCDDGNTASGDGCSASCALEACGDGVLGSGETCDDGNTVSGDGCRENCTEEVCGDGILDDPPEGCDDGDTTGGDGCRGDCTRELCGDGVLDAGEQCDDGNTVAGDGCTEACDVETCGDGVLDAGEECDDGNTAAGDGCRADCTEEVCGDGVLDAGEECDDGNTANFDGCPSNCLLPPVAVAPEDARFNNPLNLALDSTASVTDFVSYPGGDREDRVRWDIIGMNPNPSLSGGRARLILAVSCFGTNTDQVQIFTGGQTYACGQTIVDEEVTFDSKTGSLTITAVGGTATYVQWVLTGTAVRVN